MRCLFEDRLANQSIALHNPLKRIAISEEKDLPGAFAEIAHAQQQGHWVALALDYSLGHWLEPALPSAAGAPAGQPRLTAWIYASHTIGLPTALTLDESTLETSPPPPTVTNVTSELAKGDYLAMIEDIKRHIQAGDFYQVNATFALAVKTSGDPYRLYQHLASQHPGRYSAYIEDGEQRILSFSPELFLERTGDHLTTRPMKGTAPRVPNDPVKDHAIGQALLASEKNRAENLMIVDLLRNDLGRIALPGSVKVAPLFELEAYPSVWTMTSTITATLPTDTTLPTILRALFPCGSVTGAPKIAAMQAIDRLEAEPRGIYCGSIGWLAPSGDFCLNVAIRTLVLNAEGNGQYHVGSGIVHDSIAEEEWQECFWKARILTTPQN
jgi:para-aminobenzoate synthetase component 1